MGRKEDRRKRKSIKRKLTDDQFKNLITDVNKQYTIDTVKERNELFQEIMLDCIEIALKKAEISETKRKQIIRDIELEVVRKGERHEQFKKRISK